MFSLVIWIITIAACVLFGILGFLTVIADENLLCALATILVIVCAGAAYAQSPEEIHIVDFEVKETHSEFQGKDVVTNTDYYIYYIYDHKGYKQQVKQDEFEEFQSYLDKDVTVTTIFAVSGDVCDNLKSTEVPVN